MSLEKFRKEYAMCYFKKTFTAWVLFLGLVTVSVQAASPVVTSIPVTSVNQGEFYSYTLAASDADGDALTWSVANGTSLPSWLSFNSTPAWAQLGPSGFSPSPAFGTSMAIDSNNTPYVVYYSDSANGNKASVMKFDGSSWVKVGTLGFSAGQADYPSIVIDSNDIPYVVYSDGANANKASVMKFDGSSWVAVGTLGFSAGQADYTSIAIDSNDTLYVVYRDSDNFNKASAMKFNGSSWVSVGSYDASLFFSTGQASYTSIAIDSNDIPYVVYSDSFNSNKATVLKLDGSSWVKVGILGFSAGQADYTSIAIDSNDTPYVVYEDRGNGFKASVMKFDGSSWVSVGTAGFSLGRADYTSIVIDSNDTLYVAYQDYANNTNKASVMKFDGSSWVQFGSAEFTTGPAEFISISVDNNDTPYIAYFDGSGSLSGKASVMKFNSEPVLSGNPSDTDVGEYNISLTVSDGVNTVEHNFTITVINFIFDNGFE